MTGGVASTRLSGDHGSVTIELVIVTPVALALLCLVALVGRTASARSHVDAAARDAARAASFERRPAAAQMTAEQSAIQALNAAGVRCASTSVDADVSSFGPGGQVAVTVTCDLPLSDLGLLGLSGSRAVSTRAVQPIDLYRGQP